MGKIIANFFIALDGVVEAPNEWHFPYFDDDLAAAVDGSVATSKAFLMRRKLYQEWSSYWPGQGEDDFGGFINNVPKYVLSHTLETADWNNTRVVNGDVARRVQELKDGIDGDIGMSGSATLVRWLLANNLLDELHLLIHPIAVGHGQRLFEDTPTQPLELVGHEVFGSGVLNLTYIPQPRA